MLQETKAESRLLAAAPPPRLDARARTHRQPVHRAAMGLVDYLETGVWKRDLRAEPWHKRVPVAALRALLHIIADFRHLLFSTRASALTMTTLLALVPIAALVFSVARGC